MEENENDEIYHLCDTLLRDCQISFKAKGLYFFMIFSTEKKGLTLEMIKKTSQDSERSIKMGINELEKGGYIIRNTLQNGEVSWNYNLKRSIKKEIEAKSKIADVKEKTQKDKPSKIKTQRNKNTRKRKNTKKSGFYSTLTSIFKEFF